MAECFGRKKKTDGTEGKLCAIKVMRKSELSQKNIIDLVLAERKIHQYCHPFVVSLYAAFQSRTFLFFAWSIATAVICRLFCVMSRI